MVLLPLGTCCCRGNSTVFFFIRANVRPPSFRLISIKPSPAAPALTQLWTLTALSPFPLTCLCSLLVPQGMLYMLSLPLLLGSLLRPAWSSFFLLHAHAVTFFFFAKAQKFPLRLSHNLVIWTDSSITFAKAGFGQLLSLWLWGHPLYSEGPICQSFNVKAYPFFKLSDCLGSINKSTTFLHFLSLWTICHCYIFLFFSTSHILFVLLPTITLQRIPVTPFFWRMTRLMIWPGGARCSSHPLFYVVFLYLSLIFTLFFLDLEASCISSSRRFRPLVFGATNTAFC